MMGANQSLPPNPMEPFRTPQTSREFFWVDFALKFRDLGEDEEHEEFDEPLIKRTEDSIIEWFEQDFFEALEEKLAEYFQHNDFINTIPDWQNHQNTHVFMDLMNNDDEHGGGTDRDKKILASRRPNFLRVLTPESRKRMIKDERMVGVHRSNAHIPDGVAVLHLDRYIRLDMTREFEHNFDMFGIRFWPVFDKYYQIEPSKRHLFERVSCYTQDEISRADWFFYAFERKFKKPTALPLSVSNDISGGFEADYHCRRSRFMLMSRFIVLWKWLRHQYNDYFGCMTNWFIINLAINSCLNDTVLNFKFESQKLSKEEPKIRKRTDRGIRTLIYTTGLASAIKYSFNLLANFNNLKDNRYQNQKAMKFDPVPYTNHYVPEGSKECKTKDYRSVQSEIKPVKIYKPLDDEGSNWSVIISSKSSIEALANIFVEMLEHSDDAADLEDNNQPEFWIFNSLISKIGDLRFLEARQPVAKNSQNFSNSIARTSTLEKSCSTSGLLMKILWNRNCTRPN